MALSINIAPIFPPTSLTTTALTLATIPATGTNATVLTNGKIRFANTTSGSLTVTAYGAPPGVAGGAINAFAQAESVAANAHLDVAIPLLPAGYTLQALASATGITASQISGVVMSQ